MPAERAGYTSTIFLVDVSSTMGKRRTIELPPGPNGEERSTEITNLEWALQFVKLKVQELIYNQRKTDQCGVILFGTEETSNLVNDAHNDGYENVTEFIPVAQANADTLTKIDTIQPSTVSGDPLDALIVGIEAQQAHLGKKKWTRKIIMLTDGEQELVDEDWEVTVEKMNELDIHFTLIGVDFDDPDFPYEEPDKSPQKAKNEEFWAKFCEKLTNGVIGTCALALREVSRPDIKQVNSVLGGTILRLGDVVTRPDEAIEIVVKTAKCTSISRPKAFKKFALREAKGGEADMDVDEKPNATYAQLKMRTEYFIDRSKGEDEDGDVKMEDEDYDLLDGPPEKSAEQKPEHQEQVEKEQLIRGYKYGTTYVPCPDGNFPKLETTKGIDICGFFPEKNFRREYTLGEIHYVWPDPASARQQVALSSVVQAMYAKGCLAIARWVNKDGSDPKMGVLKPIMFEGVDGFIWAQMPFADDVRKYTFASLDNLVAKNGEQITDHPYIPTQEQLDAMDEFVDAMDLMEAGDKDEDGNRGPWYDTLMSYNPALHRLKQATFHCAVVSDLSTNPLPPPHPEITKYFDPPKRVIKRSRDALEECKTVFKVKEVPKKVAKARNADHVHAEDEEELLLDRKPTTSNVTAASQASQSKEKAAAAEGSDTEEEEEEEELLLNKKPAKPAATPSPRRAHPLPTPARSLSPDVDLGPEPGRIIGSHKPLADFQKNIAQGDVVTKAVEDFAAVILKILQKPMMGKRDAEMLECMAALRDTCLKEDEIDAWNTFIKDLKEQCTAEYGNRRFWTKVQGEGRPLGLISDSEAREHGGRSNISDNVAEEFIH